MVSLQMSHASYCIVTQYFEAESQKLHDDSYLSLKQNTSYLTTSGILQCYRDTTTKRLANKCFPSLVIFSTPSAMFSARDNSRNRQKWS